MSEEKIYFNGINGDTGSYLFPPLTTDELIEVAKKEKFGQFGTNPQNSPVLRKLKEKAENTKKSFAPSADADDPTNLADTGWGVIFPAIEGDNSEILKIREALKELLDHRKEQATKNKERYYQEYIGPRGFRPDDTKLTFLGRYGVGFGPVDPNKIPYYLLIVGDPQRIPFLFQQELSVQFAVGRIYFDRGKNESEDDYLRKYAQYARSVVQAETDGLALPRRASFFGVENKDDEATSSSGENLVRPLAEWMPESIKDYDWSIETILGENATKTKLEKLLGGDETPALLFTSSHGMGFEKGHSRQLENQGAIICQDWPGSKDWNKAIPDDFFFSGEDVVEDARLLGLIAFHFACYSAGTPQFNEFAYQQDQFDLNQNSNKRSEIADQAFIARLPQRLLSHPKGGALAVIGHVERAWTSSFMWNKIDQTEVFKSTLKELVKGDPIGFAFEKRFSHRHAEIAVSLDQLFENIKYGGIVGYEQNQIDPQNLVSLWTANNDARNYIILGDPAVKLMVGDDSKKLNSERQTIEKITLPMNSPISESVSEKDDDSTNSNTELKQAQSELNQVLEKLIKTVERQGSIEKKQLQDSISKTINLLEVLNKLI